MSMTPDDRDYDRGDRFDRDRESGPRQPNPIDMPSLFLIIVAVINMLISGYLVLNGVLALSDEKAVQPTLDQLKKTYQDQGYPIPELFQDARRFAQLVSTVDFIWAAVNFVGALITLVGAIRMRSFRSYGLAVTGAIVAAIPGVSCCCLVGQGIGIWAFVVLLKPEVKEMFR